LQQINTFRWLMHFTQVLTRTETDLLYISIQTIIYTPRQKGKNSSLKYLPKPLSSIGFLRYNISLYGEERTANPCGSSVQHLQTSELPDTAKQTQYARKIEYNQILPKLQKTHPTQRNGKIALISVLQ